MYNVVVNAAWRNQDLPRRDVNGQPSRPLLPLNLYYLISACEDSQRDAHLKLGRAMLLFHDDPTLKNFSSTSGIKNQADPIRVTQYPLNIDEMSKLWSSFQTAYRPSVAYEVGVVLIESEIPDTSPLPVLRRGARNRGWDSTTSLPPSLTSVRFQAPMQPGARLGETVTVLGQNLRQAGDVAVEFRHPRLEDPFVLPITSSVADEEVSVTIPDDEDWPAGVYLVSLRNTRLIDGDEHDDHSNSIPMALLPEIDVPEDGLVAELTNGGRSLQLGFKPKLRPNQAIQLLISSRTFEAKPLPGGHTVQASWRDSDVKFPDGLTRYARLKIDGVDSLLYDPANAEQGFDPLFEVQFPRP
jgi:hypothetical protein